MNEIWKDVTGFEDFYRVSSLGRVLSLRKSKILSPDFSRAGYPSVALYGKDKMKGVFFFYKRHRLEIHRFILN